MRKNQNMPRRFLATFLAVVLAYGNAPIQVAYGVEAARTAETEQTAAESQANGDEKAVSADESSTTSGESVADVSKGSDEKPEETSPAEATVSQDEGSAQDTPTNSNDGNEDAADSKAVSQQPYSFDSVTFDGQQLNEGDNAISAPWTTGTKGVNVLLSRNDSVAVDSSKMYVLSMKINDALNFGSLPDRSKVTGVGDITIVRNETPQVSTGNSAPAKYPNYETQIFSGEIRMRLSTNNGTSINIPSMALSFIEPLVGYKATNELVDALDVKVVAVDKAAGLDYDAKSTDVQTLAERKVSSLTITPDSSAANTGVRFFSSNDGFVSDTSRINQTIDVSKKSKVSFAIGASGMSAQVFKKLVIAYHYPYVLKDGVEHYMEFDKNDSAIQTNKQGARYGYHLASPAQVDDVNHTITYTFENVMVSDWNFIAVTPQFQWPSDLDASDEGTYAVKSAGWEVVEEVNYLGANTTFMLQNGGNLLAPTKDGAQFVKDSVNLMLQSTNDAPSTRAESQKSGYAMLPKMKIYRGVSGNNPTGALGFFDLHSAGVADSPKVNIKFEFNTNPQDGAEYHVNKVNLPVEVGASGVDVAFVLSNGANTVSGSVHYGKASSSVIGCTLDYLRTIAKVDASYYIKEISYTSEGLRGGSVYHSEVVDNGARLYASEPGLFRGWISGEVGASATAKMTIASTDGVSTLTSDGKTSIESTEVSEVSDDNSTSISPGVITVDNSVSVNLTAGQSSTISTWVSIPDEERGWRPSSGDPNQLNGYHVIESPTAYVCLPDGASIPGIDQATLGTIKATSVKALDGSDCVVNGTNAKWWEVKFEGANLTKSTTLQIQISTNRMMAGVTWDFNNAFAIRTQGQYLKATPGTYYSNPMNTVSELAKSSTLATVQALSKALATDDDANTKLGVAYYRYRESRILNIMRAEAKLDVDTELSLDGQSGSSVNLRLTDPAATLDYDVDISSDDGGTASDFTYYIPITKTSSAIDSDGLVGRNDYSLNLKQAISITGSNKGGAALTDIPFDVLYTTEPGLNSSTVRGLSDDKWFATKEDTDFSAITAVLIRTKKPADGEPSTIWEGSKFTFSLKLTYDDSKSDFAANAGREISWRTFGHYTYRRGTAEATTNTYPSGINSIKLGYIGNQTNTPINVTLDTSSGTSADVTTDLGQLFSTDKTFKIKKVAGTNVTLTDGDPTGKSGREANSTFRVGFALNGGTSRYLKAGGVDGTYSMPTGSNVSVGVHVDFSRALTDITTPRHIDVTFGDDDVDMTVRINFNRTVKPAEATDAGVAVGENYIVPNVSPSVSIASDSAFTALFPIDGFVPSNYSAQKLKWKTSTGASATIPPGTSIIMVGLKTDKTPESYWVYKAAGNESEIDLNKFQRMSSTGESFSYDTKTTSATSLKYLFVVNFAGSSAKAGSYKIAFGADAVPDAAAFTDVDKSVTLVNPASFTLTASGSQLDYRVTATDAGADESYLGDKSLALVLKPAAGTKLPLDAKLSDGGTSYARNSQGEYVIPLNAIEDGSKSLSIESQMLSVTGGDYKLDARLILVGTHEAKSPYAGVQVGQTAQITLSVAASELPSLSASGVRVAKVTEWATGQKISLDVRGVPAGGSVTVTAYSGADSEKGGTKPVTDLLSSVDGRYVFKDGVGTFDESRKSTGQLVLNSTAPAGTYRLVFEVKGADGKTVLEVPYVIIVRE